MQRTLQSGEPPTRLFVLSYSFAIMSAGCSLIILRMCTPTTSATTSETIEILIIMGITGETSSLGIPCCIPHSCNNVLKITNRGMLITIHRTNWYFARFTRRICRRIRAHFFTLQLTPQFGPLGTSHSITDRPRFAQSCLGHLSPRQIDPVGLCSEGYEIGVSGGALDLKKK